MPTYEYLCDDCGEFAAYRPIAKRDEPCICPNCGTPSPRVILSAPSLATMAGHLRAAHATNERAAHAPRTSAEYKATHQHGPGCGCCGGGKSKSTVTTADGKKTFPSKRPWMISH
ncbi:FmdB family zinc ribbon protein [Pseudothauera rhizosphaerae]|uniref:Zinc ribbon domain-containing protein n=1 Tax=Pseudothauera rhizosphaerae TaxID=2565932 RepID=A0A4S4AJG0_9RHOO|nr:zinc ribbon domain-containing protein [Pseudothauera rhizosphaerae]THF59433.1 zinc ribbon domain-containing protein [Pseudothauera rhizosphaerae]